ncbi:unnamed protein product [Victoria cruziana]
MSGIRGDILDVTTPLAAVPPCGVDVPKAPLDSLSIDTQLRRPITNATGVGAILIGPTRNSLPTPCLIARP